MFRGRMCHGSGCSVVERRLFITVRWWLLSVLPGACALFGGVGGGCGTSRVVAGWWWAHCWVLRDQPYMPCSCCGGVGGGVEVFFGAVLLMNRLCLGGRCGCRGGGRRGVGRFSRSLFENYTVDASILELRSQDLGSTIKHLERDIDHWSASNAFGREMHDRFKLM